MSSDFRFVSVKWKGRGWSPEIHFRRTERLTLLDQIDYYERITYARRTIALAFVK